MKKTPKHVFQKIIITILVLIMSVLVVRGYYSIRYMNQTFKIDSTYDIDSHHIDGVQIKHVETGSLNGYHFIPDHKTHEGVIIAFGGAEGQCEQWFGEYYSTLGYEVLCLYYFGQANQPKKLEEVPIEFFDEALCYLDHPDDLTVYGVSKGAELALLLATHYECIDHLILNGPSSHIYPGTNPTKSAWSYQGKPLETAVIPLNAYLPTIEFFLDLLVKKPTGCIKSYDAILANQKDIDTGRIRVEDIDENVDILMFAGTDDRMWASSTMANLIKEHRPIHTELILLEGAGHVFYVDHLLLETNGCVIYAGGTLKKNKDAFVLFKHEISKHLDTWCK